MTNKRYTDEEIIKALECCLCDNSECLQCQNKEVYKIECNELATKTLDLITRKILEIERLKAEIGRLQKEANLVSILFQDLQEKADEIKTEAYKDFTEKLKKELLAYRKKYTITLDDESVFAADKLRQMIDNLLKEMGGEEE